jgi:hypothetical protein
MLRNVFVGTGVLSALMLLPAIAVAAEPVAPLSAAPLPAAPLPVTTSSPIEPITLAEVHAIGPTAQAVDPLPKEQGPELPGDSAPAPAPLQPSPWAGTVELYGFAPLRATSVLKQAATTWDRPGLLGQRASDRNLGQLAGKAGGKLQALPDLTFPDGRVERLRDKVRNVKLPDQIEIPGFTSVTDVGLGSLLEHLTDIFFLRGSVEYNRVGFQTDLSYVGVAGQTAKEFKRSRRVFPNLPVPTRTLKNEVSSTQGIYDFALRYRLGERERAISTPGAFTLIPYAGVRVVDLGLETTSTFEGPLVQKSRQFSFGNPIAQPLLGVQGQVFLAPRLRLFARGDLGGFGANGAVDMSGNAQAGVGYALGNSTQLDLSWRYLYLARDNGKTPSTAYTIDQNGIEVGVKVFF